MKDVFKLTTKSLRGVIRAGFVLSCLLAFFSVGMAQQKYSVTVTDQEGTALNGATILVKGSATGAFTDENGKAEFDAPSGSTLIVSMVSYVTQEVTPGADGMVTVTLQFSTLEEVVVTGYTSQRKKDITGAVSVIDTDEMNSVSASSFVQKLEGRASGVQISTSGAPGAGSAVRIRGFGGFNGSDPLYVIDGVQVKDAFGTGFNPSDIETIQVLKDASAASIYGTQANNGVIIITTKKGKAGKTKVTYNGYAAVQTPVGQYDLITNPADYSEVVYRAHENAGLQVAPEVPYSLGRGQIPDYLYYHATSGYPGSTPVDESTYSYPNQLIHQSNRAGTDWWDEVFDPALVTEHTVGISGGTQNSNFYISTGYLNEQGTMIHTYFERFSLRANSSFTAGKFTFGENFTLTRSQSVGQNGGNQTEQNTMTNILKAQSIIPVFDVSGVNFASGKSNGLSNVTNPVARQFRSKDNVGTFYRALGSIYGEYEIIDGLKFRTNLGFDFSNNFTQGFNFPTFENSEPTNINSFSENWRNNFSWLWTNQVTYNKSFGKNTISALAGYEAFKFQTRGIGGSFAQYFTDNINAWYLSSALANPDTRSVGSNGGFRSRVSQFAKVDYAYDDKYLISGTVRRDGSSNFGDDKFGIFPAVSLGWRLSAEPFMANVGFISDLKLRFGWGITGNDDIRTGNFADQFGGGTNSSFYALGGGNSLVTGYALTALGNPLTQWEENVSTNLGFDASLFDGRLNLVLDLWQRETDGLLFNPSNPGTAGAASPAFINIAAVENRGVDFSANFVNQVGDWNLDFGINVSHYRNEIVAIDGASDFYFPSDGGRLGINRTINKLGFPIGSFNGYTNDGIFRSQAEVDAHAAQDGKSIGRLRFSDLTGDGVVNGDDIDIIGNYHPDATIGFTANIAYRNFDLSAFFFSSIGNEIMNYNKLFEIFRFFNTNVRKEVLTESFHPTDNPNGTLPWLDENDTFSEQPSSWYVEDGSYLRLRTLQIGYNVPSAAIGGNRLRVYLQGQNLFTITGYSGIDPALSNFGQGDSFGGVDEGNYPGSKRYMIGVELGF